MERLRRRNPAAIAALGLTLVGLVMGVAALALASPKQADAIAPCVPHTLTSEELGLLSSLQVWRNTNIAGSLPLTQSTHLNAAAQGYAQFLANTPGASGHYADGATWVSRAVSCGYPSNIAAGGEGVALAGAAFQAFALMTGSSSGGVNVPSSSLFPIKCVGVGKGTSTDGSKTAWVALFFGTFGGDCPGATSGGGGGPPPTVPASATTPATATPTKTPTPSPTPTPTPPLRADGATLTIYEGWNLVTLPTGQVTDVLYRASGCYRAIYQQQGTRWLRYSPEAPAYANNLQTLNGGAFWIEGTAANCGPVKL